NSANSILEACRERRSRIQTRSSRDMLPEQPQRADTIAIPILADSWRRPTAAECPPACGQFFRREHRYLMISDSEVRKDLPPPVPIHSQIATIRVAEVP